MLTNQICSPSPVSRGRIYQELANQRSYHLPRIGQSALVSSTKNWPINARIICQKLANQRSYIAVTTKNDLVDIRTLANQRSYRYQKLKFSSVTLRKSSLHFSTLIWRVTLQNYEITKIFTPFIWLLHFTSLLTNISEVSQSFLAIFNTNKLANITLTYPTNAKSLLRR